MSINKGPVPQCLLPPVKPKPKPAPVPVPKPENETPVPIYKTIMVKSSETVNGREPQLGHRKVEKKIQKEIYPSARDAISSPVPVVTRGSVNNKEFVQSFPSIKVEKCEEMRSLKDNKIRVVTEYLAPVIPTRSRSSSNLAPPSPMFERRSGKLVSLAFPQSNLLSSLSKSEGNIPETIFGGYSRHCGSTENLQSEYSNFKTTSRSEGRISPDTANLLTSVQRPRSPANASQSATNDVRSKYLKSFSIRDMN